MDPREYVAELRALPPIPRVARELLVAVEDANSNFARLGEIIQQDPPLTAKLLALANSAYFSRATPVCKIDQAIATIGTNRTKNIAIGLALIMRFNPQRCPPFDLARYWYDASMTAWAAEILVRTMKQTDLSPNCAYLAGLLHNLGLPALAHVASLKLAQALRNKAAHPDLALAEHEIAALSMDHHEAGAMVLENWGLPEKTVVVARHLWDPDYIGPDREWVILVRACVAWKRGGFETYPATELALNLTDTERDRLNERAMNEAERTRLAAQAIF